MTNLQGRTQGKGRVGRPSLPRGLGRGGVQQVLQFNRQGSVLSLQEENVNKNCPFNNTDINTKVHFYS